MKPNNILQIDDVYSNNHNNLFVGTNLLLKPLNGKEVSYLPCEDIIEVRYGETWLKQPKLLKPTHKKPCCYFKVISKQGNEYIIIIDFVHNIAPLRELFIEKCPNILITDDWTIEEQFEMREVYGPPDAYKMKDVIIKEKELKGKL